MLLLLLVAVSREVTTTGPGVASTVAVFERTGRGGAAGSVVSGAADCVGSGADDVVVSVARSALCAEQAHNRVTQISHRVRLTVVDLMRILDGCRSGWSPRPPY